LLWTILGHNIASTRFIYEYRRTETERSSLAADMILQTSSALQDDIDEAIFTSERAARVFFQRHYQEYIRDNFKHRC
jgi:uroporphyrinogen-III synthase